MADDALKIVSLLLQYPSEELRRATGELRSAAGELTSRPARDPILGFLDWYEASSLDALQRAYVETFDFTRRHSLYLTYHVHGDLRQRGIALLRIKQGYAAAGFELDESELPDYLPVMLEFAWLAPDGVGLEVLAGHREAIELLRSALHHDGSPYAGLVHAVAGLLPRLTRPQAARVARLAKDGPPTEEVGLEPFAPPEVMPPASEPLRGAAR